MEKKEVILINLELMKQSQIKCKQRAYENHIKKLKEKSNFRENLNLIRFSNGSGCHMNCFRFNLSEDLKHIMKKLEIYIELMNKEHKFITEGVFLNGSKCDILDLTDGIVYEVLNSEDERRFEDKIKKYPERLEIIQIKV